jgi:hypothetical protein
MVRYADDFVMGIERLEDVHKVQRVIAKRFARFGLKINTEKTRLVRFGRPPRAGVTGDKPATFDFLGFTHYWGWIQRRNRSSSPNWERFQGMLSVSLCFLLGSFTQECNETTTPRNRMR